MTPKKYFFVMKYFSRFSISFDEVLVPFGDQKTGGAGTKKGRGSGLGGWHENEHPNRLGKRARRAHGRIRTVPPIVACRHQRSDVGIDHCAVKVRRKRAAGTWPDRMRSATRSAPIRSDPRRDRILNVSIRDPIGSEWGPI